MKIGEVAKLLNLPVTTVRFYEDAGILNPERNKESRYREYSTWDVYNLLECMRFRNMGLSVKDIAASLHDEQVGFLKDKLNERSSELEREIEDHTALLRHIQELRLKLDVLPYNLGNFWVTRQPERLYFITNQYRGSYTGFVCGKELYRTWIQYMPFTYGAAMIDVSDAVDDTDNACVDYVMMTDKAYAERVGLECSEEVKTLPEQLCLSTVVDGGEKGSLTAEFFKQLLLSLDSRYEPYGKVVSNLIARCADQVQTHRYYEVMIPIRFKENRND